MSRWSRFEIQNIVRELASHSSAPNESHMKAMPRYMNYYVSTSKRWWYLKPVRRWDYKDRNFAFRVRGCPDSDNAKCPITRRSVLWIQHGIRGCSIHCVKCNANDRGAISYRSGDNFICLICPRYAANYADFAQHRFKGMELLMVLYMHNSAPVDLMNGWSAGEREKEPDTCILYWTLWENSRNMEF